MTEPQLEEPRVEVIEKTTPHDGYFRVDKLRLKHRRFAGGWTGEMTREVFERGHAAVVLPYDAVRDEVVLIEQFRIGALTAGRDPWLVEAVAGIVEPGETPEDVVRREAVEEAGCAITALEVIGEVFPSPGGCSELLTLYCGRVDSAGAGGLFGLDHEGEDIRAFTLPFDEAFARLARAEFLNANLVITLQWLALNRERLKRAWK